MRIKTLAVILALVLFTTVFTTGCSVLKDLGFREKEITKEEFFVSLKETPDPKKEVTEFQDVYNLAQEQGYMDFKDAKEKRKGDRVITEATFGLGGDKATVINQKTDAYSVSYLTKFQYEDGKLYFLVSDRSKNLAIDMTPIKDKKTITPTGAFIKLLKEVKFIPSVSAALPPTRITGYNLDGFDYDCVINKFDSESKEIFESDEFKNCMKALKQGGQDPVSCTKTYGTTYDTWNNGVHDILQGDECRSSDGYDASVIAMSLDKDPDETEDFTVYTRIESIGTEGVAKVDGRLFVTQTEPRFRRNLHNFERYHIDLDYEDEINFDPLDFGIYHFKYVIENSYRSYTTTTTDWGQAFMGGDIKSYEKVSEADTKNNEFVIWYKIKIPTKVEQVGTDFVDISLDPHPGIGEYTFFKSEQGPPETHFVWRVHGRAPDTATSYKYDGLTEGKQYYFMIVLNRKGGSGAITGQYPSKILEAITYDKSQIDDLKADEVTRYYADLSWDGAAFLQDPMFDHFEISVDYSTMARNIKESSHKLTGLLPMQTYQLKVNAISKANQKIGVSDTLTITTPDILPLNLEISDATRTSFTASWNPYKLSDFSKTQLEISKAGQMVDVVKLDDKNTETYTLDNLQAGQNYELLVKIFIKNPLGGDEIISSGRTVVRTSEAEGIPLSIDKVSGLGHTRHALNPMWEKVAGADSYDVTVQEKGGQERKVITKPSTTGDDARGYGYLIKDLEADTDHIVRVKAKKGEQVIGLGQVEEKTKDKMPLNFKADKVTSTSIPLDWKPYVDYGTFDRYEVYLGDNKVKEIKEVIKNDFSIDDLEQQKTYEFTVKTYEKFKGKEELSGEETITVKTEKLTQTDLKLRMTGSSYTYVDLEWDKYLGDQFSSYAIYYKKANDPNYRPLKVISSRDTTKTRMENLFPGQAYTFQLVIGQKPMSNIVSTITPIKDVPIVVNAVASPNPVQTGNPLTFTIDVTNNGPDPITITKIYVEAWWNSENRGYAQIPDETAVIQQSSLITSTVPPGGAKTLIFSHTYSEAGGKGDWYHDAAIFTSKGVFPVMRQATLTVT